MLISVIIPVHNRKDLLPRAINSVLNQTFKDFELIVVDDGSTDGVEKLDLLSSGKIKFLRLPINSGVAIARNCGVDISEGEWVAFLDSDDVWMPRKLEKQVKWIEMNPGIRILQSKEIWIRNGKRVNPPATHEKSGGDLFRESLERCMITPSSVMMERALFEEVGRFDGSLPACEDYDLWLRITCRYPVGLVNEYLLYRYGGHPDQLSSSIMALDRFRVRSLLRLLSLDCLNSEQRGLVRTTLVKKAAIVANGYRKRGNVQLYERFQAVVDKYKR
ncbi:MAG: glycosyltransferase family 2 protein [Fibrobacter sp.]|jgi:glycosyltransferase involved in cell wall biosynthesis|nr:glycosyltransferase family 2 protein [Fibrobacter sp.]